jgi:hypothetical protein
MMHAQAGRQQFPVRSRETLEWRAGRHDEVGDLQALRSQVERQRDGFIVRAQHRDALAGADAMAVQQPLRGCAEQHAGQVVIVEYGGLLDAAGGQHHRAGPQQREATVLAIDARDREFIVRVATHHAMRRPHFDGRVRTHGIDEPAAVRGVVRPRLRVPGAAAARLLCFIDQHHALRAGACRGQRGGQAGYAGADHRDLAVRMPPRTQLARRIQLHHAQSAERADGALEPREAARAHEGLVVEAHRQEARQQAHGRRPIVRHAAARVHRAEGEVRAREDVIAALVGFRADLEQVVGVVARRGDEPARPVVFEAACRDHHAGAGQCRSQRVADEGIDGAAFELQPQRPRAVDPFAGHRLGQAAHHGRASCSCAAG